MTIGDLIEKLQQFDQGMPVVVANEFRGHYSDLEQVKPIDLVYVSDTVLCYAHENPDFSGVALL